MARKPIPEASQTAVLTRSARRCALCFGLSGDLSEKRGQLAHVDQNRDNHAEDNLVYLCLDHHDQYDSTTRQSKGLTEGEVRGYRDRLYRAVETGLGQVSRLEAELSAAHEREREREAAVVDHDINMFSRADEILPERELVAFLDDLQTNDAYSGSSMRAVDRFRYFFDATSNHYLSSSLVDVTKQLLEALAKLSSFVALHFFVYPEPSSANEDWRFAMHPTLNIDREGSGTSEEMARYDAFQKQLDELCSYTRAMYKAYRKSIKVVLLR